MRLDARNTTSQNIPVYLNFFISSYLERSQCNYQRANKQHILFELTRKCLYVTQRANLVCLHSEHLILSVRLRCEALFEPAAKWAGGGGALLLEVRSRTAISQLRPRVRIMFHFLKIMEELAIIINKVLPIYLGHADCNPHASIANWSQHSWPLSAVC